MRKGWIAAVALAAVVGLAILLWPRGTEAPYDVLYYQTDNTEVGSVSVDGPEGGGMTQYASGLLMRKGDKFTFSAENVGWPMEITAYSGLNMEGPIATATLPDAPGENQYWLVELAQQAGQWTLSYRLTERR